MREDRNNRRNNESPHVFALVQIIAIVDDLLVC